MFLYYIFQKNKEYCKLSETLIQIFSHSIKWLFSESLYNKTYFGTKFIIEEFLENIINSLKLINDCETKYINAKDKLKTFARIQQDFGVTALCLSGGASMAYHQIGAIKAMLENNVLPHIICGTSGGALVGCFAAVRNDDELLKFLTPENCFSLLKANDEPFLIKLKRFLTTGYIFDWNIWKKHLRNCTKGDMTFLEAC